MSAPGIRAVHFSGTGLGNACCNFRPETDTGIEPWKPGADTGLGSCLPGAEIGDRRRELKTGIDLPLPHLLPLSR